MMKTGKLAVSSLLLVVIALASAGFAAEDVQLPAPASVDADGNGEFHPSELKKFVDAVIERRVDKALAAGEEKLRLPEVTKYRRLAKWLEARAKKADGHLSALSRLDKSGDDVLTGKEYEAVREVVRRSVYCTRSVDRSKNGVIDGSEYSLAYSGEPARPAKKKKGAPQPPAQPISHFDRNRDMELSVQERIQLAVTIVARKERLEAQAVQMRRMSLALDAARGVGEAELVRRVAGKKAAKQAERDKQIRGIGEAAPADR